MPGYIGGIPIGGREGNDIAADNYSSSHAQPLLHETENANI